MFFAFCLLTHGGSLFLPYCTAFCNFLFQECVRPVHGILTLLLRYTMERPHPDLLFGVEQYTWVSVAHLTLPGICLSTDGGLGMAFYILFYILFYSLREQGNGAKQGKTWLTLSQLLLRILPTLPAGHVNQSWRVLAHCFGKQHIVTALPAWWRNGIFKKTHSLQP